MVIAMGFTEHKLINGIRLSIESGNEKVIDAAKAYYSDVKWGLKYECPFCGSDIDNQDGIVEDDTFEDTFFCKGQCDVLITFVSPLGLEYHEVHPTQLKIIIEFMYGDHPASWDFYNDLEPGYNIEFPDEPIKRDPNQMSFLD